MVVKLHAAGGLGQVSLAFDPSLNRTVAIKEVRPEFADRPSVRGRFVDEAETAAALDHPGIVLVYAIGHDDNGRPYYAMKFVEGQTLEQAVNEYHRRPSPVQFNRLLRHFLDACHAVAYAHDRACCTAT